MVCVSGAIRKWCRPWYCDRAERTTTYSIGNNHDCRWPIVFANWIRHHLHTASLTDLSFSGPVGGLEDDIVTPGTGDGMVNPGLEDRIATTGPTGGLNEFTGKVPLGSVPEKGELAPRAGCHMPGDDIYLDMKSTTIQ